MIIYPNGTFHCDRGERIPFICPKCQWPIEYDEKVLFVNCFHCKYIGDKDEFSKYVAVKNENRDIKTK